MEQCQPRTVADVRPEPAAGERRAIELALAAAAARERAAAGSGRGAWWHVGVRENARDSAAEIGPA